MEPEKKAFSKRVFYLYLAAVFCFAINEGFSLNIFSNFFKDAYNVSDQVRGWIETPRESPGVFCMFYLPALAMFSDATLAMIGAFICSVTILIMGVSNAGFPVMMVVLLCYSFGSHTYYPMESSMGVALANQSGNMGKLLGQVKAMASIGYFFTATCVFIFFRTGFFDFTAPIKRPFVFAAIAGFITTFLLSRIRKELAWMPRRQKNKLVIKKEFTPYYLLTLAFGIQKRIRMVFGLWVFTQLLSKKADFTAILLICSAVVGIIISPYAGAFIDTVGRKKALLFEGVYMIVVFGVYGYVAMGFSNGTIDLTSPMLIFSIFLFVAADMTKLFEFFHNYAMRQMAIDESDVSPTLTVGQAIDHLMAITLSPVFGIMWAHFGPQSVFWTCAATAIIQIAVSLKLPEKAE